jgi:hypothetical protein
MKADTIDIPVERTDSLAFDECKRGALAEATWYCRVLFRPRTVSGVTQRRKAEAWQATSIQSRDLEALLGPA